MIAIKKVLTMYWQILENIFRYYRYVLLVMPVFMLQSQLNDTRCSELNCSARDGDPFSVTWMSFNYMITQCKIPIAPIFRIKEADNIFIASNSYKVSLKWARA